jgi:hypothetical protein
MLKIPVFRQPKGSMLCGPYCAMMLYHYYGKRLSIKEVMKGVRPCKDGVWASNIGIGFIKNGFDAKLVQLRNNLFPPKYRKMGNNAILKDMKREIRKKDKHTPEIKWNIKFIEAGGKVEHRVLTLEDIKKALKQKNPPMMAIDRKVLYGKEVGFSGHYVIPVNFTKDNVTINDPSHKHGGIKTYPLNDFLYAFYSWKGIALFVKPRK